MSTRKRRPRVNRHFKIDLLVRPADLAAYRMFLLEPATTVDRAHAWLKARGYATISRSAVARHLRLFLEREGADAARLRTAQMFAVVAGSPDAPDLLGGALLSAEQQLLEKVWDFRNETAWREQHGDWVKPAEICEMVDLLLKMVHTREQFEAFKRAAAREEAAGARGEAQAPPKDAAKDAPALPHWEQIAREVRRQLGHPLPPG